MRPGTFLVVASAFVALGVASLPGGLRAQTAAPEAPEALTGVVSSPEEPAMEGVVVNARRDGANFTVSVVSDAQGKYHFPRTHLEPGKYTLTIRAVGYDLTDPGAATVAAGKATAVNLKLQKTRDLAAQLSPIEWAMSIPGTP